MQLRSICAAAVSVLLHAGATAQDASAAPSEPLTPPASLRTGIVPIHTGTDEPDSPYGIWGAVEPYFKVSFHSDMTFVPYLGNNYPHNQPWRWHTTSVAVGNKVLMRDGDVPERIRASDTRYEYRFGQVTEAYDLREQALEQTFVVEQRPEARGDLVVRGRIGTLLDAPPLANAHQSLVFSDDNGTEIITYGEATVVDKKGRTLPIATGFDGEQITLTVPASFLEEATFPVTIDPLLTLRLIESSNSVGVVDVCRDNTGNRVMFVYNRAASVIDSDAFARIANDALTSSSLVFTDVTISWSNPVVCCATSYVPAERLCIVIVRGYGTLSNSRIRYQIRDSGNTTLSNSVRMDIFTPAGSDYTNPHVGGYLNGLGFLIAFQKDFPSSPDTSEIWAAQVAPPGLYAGPFQVPKWHSGGDAAFPSVSQRAGLGSQSGWMLSWQEWSNLPSANAWDIVIRRVSGTSALPGTLTLGANRQKLAPQVEGDGMGRYAVAYSSASTAQLPGKTALKTGYGADLVRFDWPQGGIPSVLATTRIVDSSRYSSRRWQVGRIAYDERTSSHWSFTLHDGATGVGYVGRVGYHGRLTEGPLRVDGPPWMRTVPGALDYDDDNERWVLAWGKGNDIWGNHFVYRTPAPVQVAGTSCGPGTISWWNRTWTPNQHQQQIGSEYTQVLCQHLGTNAFGLVAVGLRPRSVSLPIPPFGSGCRRYLDILATSDLHVGESFALPVPLPEGLLPATLLFQGYYLDPAVNRFYSTQLLSVPIIK